MSKDWKESKSYTLSPEEVEKILRNDFGEKLQPVDSAKLAAQQRQRARYQTSK